MKLTSFQTSAIRLHQEPAIKTWVFCYKQNDPSALRLLYGNEKKLPQYFQHQNSLAIFEGTLYNRETLEREFRNDLSPDWNDAALICQAYLRWGESFLDYIRGIFVIIVLDQSRSQLSIARDPLGIHSAFYSDTNGYLLVSSSIPSLLATPWVSRRLNRAALADQLCHRFPVPDETFFTDIKRVMAGHVLIDGRSSRRSEHYWDPLPAGQPVNWIHQEASQQFDQVLDQAVARCLSIGPSAIFLSGGLDSVSIAAVASDIAHRQHHPSPWALSLAFPHPDCSEEPIQRGVAKGLELPHLVVPFEESVGKEGLLASAIKISQSLSTPTLNPWRPAYLHLATEARNRGCRVIMNGAGGDEWLTVNPRYAADLIRYLNFTGLYRLTGNFLRSYKLPRHSLIRHVVWTSGLQPLMALYGSRVIRKVTPDRFKERRRKNLQRSTREWVAPDPELRRQLDERLEHNLDQLMQAPEIRGKHGFYFSSLPKSFINVLKSIEFEEDFEIGSSLGLRIVPPYYDPDLLEVLLRIPPETLHKGGREKGVVRETLDRRFPALKFEKQKKASAIQFFQSILLTEGPNLWQKLGGGRVLAQLGIVDLKVSDGILRDSLSSNLHFHTHRIWELLSMEAWTRAQESNSIQEAE